MKKILSLCLLFALVLSVAACSKADENYGESSKADTAKDKVSESQTESVEEITTMDRKMSSYFDTSLFDEENYSDVYLGKKFKFDATYVGCKLVLPETMEDLISGGWKLADGSEYNDKSLVFAKETVALNFVNSNGSKLSTLFYNSSNSSVKLLKCNIVKFRIENNYNKNTNNYDEFNINGIANNTNVNDVVATLGTPSHFYQVSKDYYYFDYFISASDRRNKIRVFVNLTDDSVTAIEFSYYK